MSIKFLFDENLEDRLRLAVTRHNLQGIEPIDIISIGDPPDLPRGIDDPDILIWAHDEARILVSHDLSTLPNFLAEHLRDHGHSPGVFLIRRWSSVREIIDILVLISYASESWEWENRCQFIPF